MSCEIGGHLGKTAERELCIAAPAESPARMAHIGSRCMSGIAVALRITYI